MSMTTKKIFLLLIGVVGLLYLPFLQNAFVSDDIPGIVEGAKTWTWPMVIGWPHSIHLGMLLQYATYLLFGPVAWPFRLENMLFHAGSVILVFCIGTKLTKSRTAFAAAVLFAVHPLATESVTWISGGLYAQYTFWFLAAFWAYLKKTKQWYAASLFFVVLSLLTSEKAMSLPLVFVGYEWFFGSLRKHWKRLIPFFIFSACLMLFYGLKIGERTQTLTSSAYQSFTGLLNPLQQIPVALSSYIQLFVFPVDLTLYHSELTFSRLQFAVRLIGSVGMFLFFGYMLVKRKHIGFWVFWFLIGLLPTLTPFKIGWIIAERYVYLSLIGLCMVVGIGFDALLSKKRWYVPTLVAGILVVLLLCAQTLRRNAEWRTQDSLWIATARTSPSHPATWNNMGDVYSRRGDWEQAAIMFQRAITLNPNYADAYHNLGSTLVRMGRFAEATTAYRKAVALNPDLWQSYRDLTVIFLKQQAFSDAKTTLLAGLRIAPDEPTLLKLQDIMKGTGK